MAESMESRIFTRAGAFVFKCGGLAVKYLRERERERVAKLLEWPRKSVILFTAFALFNSLWGMGITLLGFSVPCKMISLRPSR
jgi:hypothetical protein